MPGDNQQRITDPAPAEQQADDGLAADGVYTTDQVRALLKASRDGERDRIAALGLGQQQQQAGQARGAQMRQPPTSNQGSGDPVRDRLATVLDLMLVEKMERLGGGEGTRTGTGTGVSNTGGPAPITLTADTPLLSMTPEQVAHITKIKGEAWVADKYAAEMRDPRTTISLGRRR